MELDKDFFAGLMRIGEELSCDLKLDKNYTPTTTTPVVTHPIDKYFSFNLTNKHVRQITDQQKWQLRLAIAVDHLKGMHWKQLVEKFRVKKTFVFDSVKMVNKDKNFQTILKWCEMTKNMEQLEQLRNFVDKKF